MFEMEFKFSKLVKIIVFRCLQANKRLAAQSIQHTLCVTEKVHRHLSKKVTQAFVKKKKILTVKSLRYMDEVFFPTNDFLLLESYRLYIQWNLYKADIIGAKKVSAL